MILRHLPYSSLLLALPPGFPGVHALHGTLSLRQMPLKSPTQNARVLFVPSSLASCSAKASHIGLSTFESDFSPPSVSAESHGLLQALDKKWSQG